MSKLTEVIAEVIHTACQAELVYDEEIQRKALGDIYETIGKVLKLPADASSPAGREARPVRKNPTTKKCVKWPEGFSVEVEKNGRKLVGVITESGEYINDSSYPYKLGATVYEGNDIVFSIDSCARGLAFQRKILIGAMRNAIMYLTHSRRYKKNKAVALAAAKEGGAK